MSRSLFAVALGAGLLVTASGCRTTNCGSNNRGLFSSNSNAEAPCRLTGSGSGKITEGCFDPVTGQPVPCPPVTNVIPGGSYPGIPGGAPGVGTRPDELPFPTPGDMIPRPNVPFAQPGPAPGMEGASANPKSGAVPVKVGTNK